MYYFPYIVVSGTPSSAQIKLESKRTQIPLCICIIFYIAWEVMNVRIWKQKTPCQNLYGIFGKSEFFPKIGIFFFENQLKRDIYTQV